MGRHVCIGSIPVKQLQLCTFYLQLNKHIRSQQHLVKPQNIGEIPVKQFGLNKHTRKIHQVYLPGKTSGLSARKNKHRVYLPGKTTTT